MSKLIPILAAAALASQVSCFYPEPPPPPHRPAYGPDYDISPPPPPTQPTPSPVPDLVAPQTPPPAPQPPVANGSFPMATKTDDPNQVISPYEPHNVIDISDPRIPPGKLARDPSNNKIFRVPYN